MARIVTMCTIVSLGWCTNALACDPPTENTVAVGRSADGKSLLMRREDSADGSIELELLSLESGRFTRSIPIVKADDPKQKRAALRKARWSAAEKALEGQGFSVDPSRFEKLWHAGSELALYDGIKLLADETDDGGTDLVVQKGRTRKVVEKRFVKAGPGDIEQRERLAGAYYLPEDGTLVLMTGSCAGENFQVRSLPALLKAAGLE